MIRAVLFDLDGTLLDTAPDLVAALNHVRASEGLEPVEVSAFRQFVSRGAVGLITAGLPAGEPAGLEQRKSLLLDYYRDHLFDGTAPFEGVPVLLDELDRRGVPWGIVTNKPEYLTLPLLRMAGMLARSACVVCGDTLAQNKPHPAPVRLACEILGLSSCEVLMVGDDVRDLESGRAAGTHTAFAAYGYVSDDLEEASLEGSHYVQQPSQLLGLLMPGQEESGTGEGPHAP